MSTRQNKKQRKGRNHANNRERTVTTLTEDPNTHYLVPTPSEEPGHVSPSFVTSVVPPHSMSLGPQYPVAGNFSYGYTAPFPPVQHTNMHQQPYYSTSPQQVAQQPPSKSTLPPGKSDLEILQNLKKLIIEGQHPFYRAVPSPAALASLYKGPIPAQSQPEPDEQHLPGLSPSFGARDIDRRQPRRQMTDPRNQDKSNGVAENGAKTAQPPTVSNLSLGALQISKDTSGPSSADIQSAVSPHEHVSVSDSVSMDVDRPTHGDSGAASVDQSRTRPPQAATPRSVAPPSVDHGYGIPLERDTTPRPPRPVVSTNSNSPASFEGAGRRPALGHDGHKQRVYSPAREWYPNDHERRIVYERPSRDTRPSESQRPVPLPESNSQKADSMRPPSVFQAPSEKTASSDMRPEARPTAPIDDPKLPIQPPENDLSTREPDAALAAVDSRLQENTGSDPVAPSHYADRPSSDAEDVRSSRESSPHLADATSALSSIPPPPSAESLPPVVDSPAVPPPSLKERINSDQLVPRQPKPAAESNAAAEHLSAAQPQQQDRFGKKNKFQRHHYNGPGKFGRQNTPVDGPPPGSGGHAPRAFRPRSPSLDGRKPREYRGPPPLPPTRDLSRDRAAYRAEYDPRRPDIIDPDMPLSARYDKRPYDEFAQVPGSERRPSAYPSSPPPLSGGRPPPPVEAPLRHDYYAYPPPRNDWGMDEDDYYKSRGWERPPPPSGDRERFERDPYGPRPGSWDARQEREFRDPYPPGAPIPPDDRYPPGPPMVRDIDRSGRPPPGYSAPYGRVRGRSPSPVGRPGLNPLDDVRPPMKRAREDFPADYYPTPRAPPRRPSGPEYPPPHSAGQGASAEWPPPGSAGSGGGPLPPRSRQEYRPAAREPPMEYGPPPYERGPPGPPGRMAYGANHGGMNDRGGYPPRPPQ